MAFWDTVLNTPADASPYGKRLIPKLVDENARIKPERACFSIPRSDNLADGFRDISWREYANAINKTAHFVEKEIGRSSTFETIMYLGVPDLRVFIVLVALIKTGHKTLFSSYHNSLAAHTELIKQTQCTKLLHTAGFPTSNILEKNRLDTYCLPELEYLLRGPIAEPYPYRKTFDEAKNDPCFIVHTSGSTGMPKPVEWSHWSLSTVDSHRNVPPLNGRPCLWESFIDVRERNYCGWPIFNGSGLSACIMEICFNTATIVVGPPVLATADIFNQMLDYGNIDSASCIPSTLEETARRPDILPKLRKLKLIVYVGGSLSQEAGDAISKHTTLCTLIASTETNSVVQHPTDREDWGYFHINPIYNGIEMRPLANLFELVYVKRPEYAEFQGVFKNFPELDEFSMQDLYSPHPTKSHHWKHEGRKDDIIVFRNGQKFNPQTHEYLIAQDPKVQYALMVGTGRDKTAVIIQLHPGHYTEDKTEQKKILESLWPRVIQANNVAENYSQLEQRYVIFAKKNKPFQVSLKNTVLRKATGSIYAKEIDGLYDSIKSGGLKELFRSERV